MNQTRDDVSDALKSIREGLKCFGYNWCDHLSDEQLTEIVRSASKAVASAGMSVAEFTRAFKSMEGR